MQAAAWGLPQFAFLRAVAQGVEEASAWKRYLGFQGEKALPAGYAAALTRRLRDHATAMADGEPSQAATIRAAVAVLSEKAPEPVAAPATLEQWMQDEEIDEDFYTQAELLAMYQEATAPPSPAPRSALMVEPDVRPERLEALQTLERLMARRPSPDDRIEAWLAPRLVVRIGGGTVRDLSRAMLQCGPSWTKGIKGVGATQALLLASWLDAEIGGGHVAALRRPGRPGRPPATAPRPTLAALAMRIGAGGPLLAQDAEATERHLATKGDAARQEVERFFLWLHVVEVRPLAEVTAQTVQRYLAWAQALLPTDAAWISSQPREQGDARWRPFRMPLNDRAAARAAKRLRTFLRKLAAKGLAPNEWNRRAGKM